MLGFFTEMGPFRPQQDMNLTLNPWSWNRISNMVFIEAPCYVGFSYSSATGDRPHLEPSCQQSFYEYPKCCHDSADKYNLDHCNDDEGTASDNYDLIQAFYTRYPAYKTNDLYISSESYGGHYMPTLAMKIVHENNKTTNQTNVLNFKGFAVGNPYTTTYSGELAMLETFWYRQLIAEPTWKAFQTTCIDADGPSKDDCDALYYEIQRQIGDINYYAMDYPVCIGWEGLQRYANIAPELNDQRHALLRFLTKGRHKGSNAAAKTSLLAGRYGGYEPCGDMYTEQVDRISTRFCFDLFCFMASGLFSFVLLFPSSLSFLY